MLDSPLKRPPRWRAVARLRRPSVVTGVLCLSAVGAIAVMGSGCASRNYTYYLVEPEQQKNPEFSEDETLQRPFQFGSTTSMKVRWNDGDKVTEIDVPIVSSGQRVVIEHEPTEGEVKALPSTTLLAPPPTPADTTLEKAYTSRGLRVNDEAPAISITRTTEKMKAAVKEGSYGLALEWAEMILARYPSHPRTLRAKASLLLLMGERKKAIELYEKVEAIESDPATRKKLEELQASEP